MTELHSEMDFSLLFYAKIMKKCENTVLGYKKWLKIEFFVTGIFFGRELYNEIFVLFLKKYILTELHGETDFSLLFYAI